MKKYRFNHKLSGLALVALLLTLLLVACGGETATSVKTPTSSPTTTVAATTIANATTAVATTAATESPKPAATAPVAVVDANLKTDFTVWYDLPAGAATSFKDQLTRFGKMYPGLKINATQMEVDEIGYQLENWTTAGKTPDLIVAPADYVADFAGLKAIQPAGNVVDKSLLDSFVPNALGGSNYAGAQYGLPYNYGGTAVLIYNKKLVSAPPATVADMVKISKSLNDAQDKTRGIVIDVNEPFWFAAWVGGYGGTLLDSNNKPALDSPAVVNALKFMDQLVTKDKLANPAYEPSLNQTEYAFRDGRLGMIVTGDWAVQDYLDAATGKAARATDDKLELGVAPLPKIDQTGKEAVPFNNGRTLFFGAKATGDRLKAAKLFSEYLAQPAQQMEILNNAHLLPATKTALASNEVKNDPVWSGLRAALDKSKPQPNSPEMRAVWAAIRPNLEAVVAGTMKPEDAAKQMQQMALDKIKALNL